MLRPFLKVHASISVFFRVINAQIRDTFLIDLNFLSFIVSTRWYSNFLNQKSLNKPLSIGNRRMNRSRKLAALIILAGLLSFPCHTMADKAPKDKNQPEQETYTKGRMSLQFVSGVLNSLTKLPKGSPVFGYAQTNLRFGWMIHSPSQTNSFWRGNWEVIGEVTNSFIYKGFGNYIGGITGLLRYNFVQPGWRFIPYVQGGVGIVYTDAYKDKTQQAIGQAIELTPQCSLGLRYLINKNWSLDGEAMFHHISNTGLAKRNRSINAVGGFVGVTYFFDDICNP